MWCKVQRYHREMFGMHFYVWCVVLLVCSPAKGEKLCFPAHVCVVFGSACVGWMTVLEGSVALQQNSMSPVALRSMRPHVWVEGSPSLRPSHMICFGRGL